MKFKVTYYQLVQDPTKKVAIREVVVDKNDLSWQEAKEHRKALKSQGFRSAKITFDNPVPPLPSDGVLNIV